MMKVVVLLLLIAGNSAAQQNASASFDHFFKTMLKPKPTLKDMMVENKSNEAVEKAFGKAYQTIDKAVIVLYQPIYDRFIKAEANSSYIKLSVAEQAMLKTFRQGTKGLSDAVQFDFFRMQMANRSLIANGRPMWALEMTAPKSAFALKTYQQLKTLEAGFGWEAFNAAAANYLPKFGSDDKHIEALNIKLTSDLENLPKKNVIAPEGFTYETQDPKKAVILWEQHGIQMQKAFEQQYTTVYAWWKRQYQQLESICKSLDTLSSHISSGEMSLLQPFFEDLQIRCWEVLLKLTEVAQRLFNDALIALISEQQVMESIQMYKQFNVKD